MKKIIKTIIIVIWFVLIFTLAFAVTNTNGASANQDSFSIIWTIINLLNILWLPFAIIAGKLFSNDLVYGSAFHIDTMLFHIWQFSRTFANYIIWFIFLVHIFLFLAWKVKNIADTLIKITVSSILVNASWFILWAIIDLSTILLVTVGSLPMHLMWTSATAPIQKVKYCSKISIDSEKIWQNTDGFKSLIICDKWAEKQIDSENFFKKMNNMTWPLIFIWTTILNIDKNWWINSKMVNSNSNIKKSNGIRNMLHFLVIAIFVIPIFILVIVGIVRVFWLWIYIWFSPLLILDYIFGSKYISSSNKNLKLSNVIWLIFQPVLVVMALWIAVIFLATVQTAFIWWSDFEKKAKKDLWICEKTPNSMCIWDKVAVTIKWNMMEEFMKEVWGSFWYLVLTILSFLAMWWLVKIAFHSTEITSSIADSTFKFVEEGMKVVPFIPTPAGITWIWAVNMLLNKKLLRRWFDVKAREQADKLVWSIDKFFGIWWNSIWPTIKSKYLDDLLKESRGGFNSLYSEFRKQIKELKKKYPDAIPDQDIYFKEYITEFIKIAAWKDKSVITMLNNKMQVKLKGKPINSNNINQLTADILFSNHQFRLFVEWILEKTDLISQNAMGIWSRNISSDVSDQLMQKLGDK